MNDELERPQEPQRGFWIEGGRVRFTHEAAAQLREDHSRDPETLALLTNTFGNLKDAQAVIHGPNRDLINTARERVDDPEFVSAFDAVYGIGAAKHFAQANYSIGEHLAEVIPQILGGAQEATGAFGDMFAGAIEDTSLGRWLQGRDAWNPENRAVALGSIDAAFEEYDQTFRARTASWTDARRNRRMQSLAHELDYLEGRADDANDEFSRMTPEQLANRKRQLRLEAGVLAEGTEVPAEDRRELRRRINRQVGGDVLPGDTIELPDTITGEVVAGIAQFVSAFGTPTGALTRLGIMAGSGAATSSLVAGTVAGMIADATAFDPENPLLIETITELMGYDVAETWVEAIAKNPEDPEALNRFKSALEGAGLGLAVSGLFYSLAVGARALRSGSSNAADVVKSLEEAVEAVPVESVSGSGRVWSAEELDNIRRMLDEVTEADPTVVRVPEDGSMGPANAAPSTDTLGAPERAVGADTGVPEGSPRAVPGRPSQTLPDELEATLTPGPDNPLDRVLQRLNQPRNQPTGVKRVQEIVRAVTRQIDDIAARAGDDLRSMVQTVARGRGTIFGENRTDADLVRGAAPHVRVIMDYIRSGKNGINDAIAYASAPGTWASMTDRAFAFQSVARTLKRSVEQQIEALRAAQSVPNASPEILRAQQRLVDHLAESYFKMEAVNTNIGSWWGSFGRQRRSAQIAREADELRARYKDQPQDRPGSVTEAQIRAEADAKMADDLAQTIRNTNENEDYFWQMYNKLRKGGASAEDAWRLLDDYAKTGRREGVSPAARWTPDAEAAGRAAENGNWFSRLVDRVVQYQYGSMLSGPTTHWINNTVSGAKTVHSLVTEAAWAYGRLNRQDIAGVTGRLQGMRIGFRDNMRDALTVMLKNRPMLARNIDRGQDKPFFAWGALRAMMASDQFFSGLWYRGEIASKAAREAHIMGLAGDARDKYIRKALREAFDDDGRGVDMLAVHQSRAMTFQQPFNRKSQYGAERFAAGLMDLINHPNPTIRGIANLHLPFTRIFFTLLDQGVRMSPIVHAPIQLIKKGVGKGNMRFYDDLLGNNGSNAQARAAGEFATGMALTGWAWSMVTEGRITGGSPAPWQLDPVSNEVAPPYSIRIGDSWVNYGRYEPFAFQIKLLANLYESYQRHQARGERGDFETVQEEMMGVFGAVGFMLGEIVASNPFMQTAENIVGIMGALEGNEGDLRRAAERYAQGQLDKFVPNLIRTINRTMEDGYTFTGRGIEDRLKRHFTMLADDNFNLDIARNPVTGEPVRHKAPFKQTATISVDEFGDPVAKLFMELHEATGRTFELRRPTGWTAGDGFTRGNLKADLRDLPADDGRRSVYDLFLETVSSTRIDGKTMREALTELTENPEFMALPGGNRRATNSRKVEAVLAIQKQYQDVAAEVVRTQRSFQAEVRKQLSREFAHN